MEDFLRYFFGTPSFTFDWLFRAIGGSIGLFFIGSLIFGLLGFSFGVIKSIGNKTIVNDPKGALSSIFVLSWNLLKIGFVLLVISIALKECRNMGYEEQSYTNLWLSQTHSSA